MDDVCFWTCGDYLIVFRSKRILSAHPSLIPILSRPPLNSFDGLIMGHEDVVQTVRVRQMNGDVFDRPLADWIRVGPRIAWNSRLVDLLGIHGCSSATLQKNQSLVDDRRLTLIESRDWTE